MRSPRSLIGRILHRGVLDTEPDRQRYEEYLLLKGRSARYGKDTLDHYWMYVQEFLEMTGGVITEETVAVYNRKLRERLKASTVRIRLVAVNWYLRMLKVKDSEGETLKIPLPPAGDPEDLRVLHPDDYPKLVQSTEREDDKLALRILHETGMRPSDLMNLRINSLDESNPERPRLVIPRQTKTARIARPFITKDTASEIKRFVREWSPQVYLFEKSPGVPHARNWAHRRVSQIAKRVGLYANPRIFRRSLATFWPDNDIKGLQLQGGWKDPSMPIKRYKQTLEERAWDHFQAAMNPPEKKDDPVRPGYL